MALALEPFLLEDVRRTLVAGEQIAPILGRDERLQRLHPREQPNQIILTAERKHRVDQVVTNPSFALLDLEAVGEERDQLIIKII